MTPMCKQVEWLLERPGFKHLIMPAFKASHDKGMPGCVMCVHAFWHAVLRAAESSVHKMRTGNAHHRLDSYFWSIWMQAICTIKGTMPNAER